MLYLITATATDAAPADDTELLAKDGSKEEAAADGTAGADKLFNTLVAAYGGAGSFSLT